MTAEEGKRSGASVTVDASSGAEQPVFSRQYYYGTFQGVNSQQSMPPPPPPPPPPPQTSAPVVGFPQPIAPPGTAVPSPYYYYHHHRVGYDTVPGYAVAEVRLVEHRLPCCGIGIGWLLFIVGFFLGAVPWYIGAFLLMCARLDHREKPGLFACMLAAILALIAISLGVTKATNAW